MTAEAYVNDITGRIKCSAKRRRQIKQELLSDIQARLEDGLSLEEITEQIGRPSEVADNFNDNKPDSEKTKYSFARTMTLLIPICIFIFILVGGAIYVIPSQKDIANSKYFDAQIIGNRLHEDITYLNNGDYGSVRKGATPAMNNVLQDGLMEDIQTKSGGNWGAFVSFGDVAAVELRQGWLHYAVAEIEVNYENKSVTYRITYDTDMKLAGLYVR